MAGISIFDIYRSNFSVLLSILDEKYKLKGVKDLKSNLDSDNILFKEDLKEILTVYNPELAGSREINWFINNYYNKHLADLVS